METKNQNMNNIQNFKYSFASGTFHKYVFQVIGYYE